MQPPAIGDVDLDGKVELVAAAMAAPSNLYVLSSTGQTLPGWPVATYPAQTPGRQNFSTPALGDLDGDGDLEIVFGPGDGRMLAFHHAGVTVAGWPQAEGPAGTPSRVVADLDDDGRDEVVGGAYTNGGAGDDALRLARRRDRSRRLASHHRPWKVPGRSWLQSDSGRGRGRRRPGRGPRRYRRRVPGISMRALRLDGTSIPLFPKPTSPAGACTATVPAVADLDGDGLLELAWIDRSAYLHVWDLQAPAAARRPWPMFGGNARHTAATVCSSRPTLRASRAAGPRSASPGRHFRVAGYRLDVAFDREFTMLVAGYSNRVIGNVTSYSAGGLAPATTYYARVRAEWPWRTSASSTPANATTATEGVRFYILTPCRVLDTRPTDGPTGGAPLGASSRSVFTVAGLCGVPGDATAIVSNLTVVSGTVPGTLKVLPGHLI